MTAKKGPHPDHYQGPVGGKVDPELYREEVQKLQREPQPPVEEGGSRRRGSLLRAGTPLDAAVIAVCTECELEIGFPAGAPVTPCRHCGSETFRVVS